jgi:hypothetical protein
VAVVRSDGLFLGVKGYLHLVEWWGLIVVEVMAAAGGGER